MFSSLCLSSTQRLTIGASLVQNDRCMAAASFVPEIVTHLTSSTHLHASIHVQVAPDRELPFLKSAL